MTAELIFIGMDLLEDEVAKRGSAFLIEKCRNLNFSLNGLEIVKEDRKQAEAAIRAGLERSDFVFVCTKTGELDKELQKIFAKETALAVFPRKEQELSHVFENRISRCLQAQKAGTLQYEVIKLGAGREEEVLEKVKDLTGKAENPSVKLLKREGELQLCVTALGENKKAAEKLLKPVVRELKVRFGADIYTTDEEKSLEAVVVELLKNQDLTLTTVESCTGGTLAARIINVPGASEVLKRGFVTYSNKAKRKAVMVKKHTLKTYGAVSEPCAKEMAKGGIFVSGADAALSVTGFAGPEGGTKEYPVGTVFIGCTIKGKTTVKECHLKGDRSSVREQAVAQALMLLRACILKNFEQKSGK